MATISGAAKVIPVEDDISDRVSAATGVYVAGVAPLVRGPIGVPFQVTGQSDFLNKTTPDGTIKIGYDGSYLDIMQTLVYTNKVWLMRAALNALYGGAYIRAFNATGLNFPAEFGFGDPTAGYDLTSADGRPQVADSVATPDASEEWLSVSPAFYAMAATGDPVTVSTTGVLPQPLVAGVTYFIAAVPTANKVALATSAANALAGQLVDLTSFGAGTHTLTLSAKTAVSTATATAASHSFAVQASFFAAVASGDAFTVSSSGAMPTGLSATTTYYAIVSPTAPNVVLPAATATDAAAGTPVAFTDAGSGVLMVSLVNKVAAAAGSVDLSDGSFTVNDTWYQLLRTGDAVTIVTDGGVLPAGLDDVTTYYAIKLPATDKVKLADNAADALNGVALSFNNPGSGIIEFHNDSIVPAPVTNEKVLLIYGANQGVWNNDLSIRLTNYTTNPVKVREPGAFLLEVFQGTNIVETWTVSRDPNQKDARGQSMYVETVLQGSNFINVVDNVAIDPSIAPKDQLTLLSLAGGSNGDAVTDAVMASALSAYANPDDIAVALVTDFGWTTPSYHTAIIGLCESRGDCAFVIAPPFEVEAQSDYLDAIVGYKTNTLNSVSSYGGMWSSHLLVQDNDNNRQVYVAPSSHVAGKIAAVWSTINAWTPAAGNKRGQLNVLGVHRVFSPGDMDTLYDNNVNPIRWRRGKGTTIWGQKTLQTRASDLDRMNARLTLCVIKPAITALLEDFLFDLSTVQNTTGTRALITAAITSYMQTVEANDGVYDFKVICNDSNNSASDIENNILNVWLLVKITKSVEYIPFVIGITPFGLDFAIAAASLL